MAVQRGFSDVDERKPRGRLSESLDPGAAAERERSELPSVQTTVEAALISLTCLIELRTWCSRSPFTGERAESLRQYQ